MFNITEYRCVSTDSLREIFGEWYECYCENIVAGQVSRDDLDEFVDYFWRNLEGADTVYK